MSHFLTPWFSDFNENTMVVSKLPVSFQLHNLPLHFLHHLVVQGIWNFLGKFLKVDADRASKGIFTFSIICVKVDLSKGLLDRLILLHNNLKWTQSLDYENMAFYFRISLQTSHLQNTCPQAKTDLKRKKRQDSKSKGWKFS